MRLLVREGISMKKFFSHHRIRTQLEYINLVTGLVLMIISGCYLLEREIDSFASWYIFACMYIVMDTYWCSGPCSRSRERMDLFKYMVGVAGLVVSVGFLVFIIVG